MCGAFPCQFKMRNFLAHPGSHDRRQRMTRERIMGAKLAEQVFGSDLTAVRRNYLALAHAWHPDTSREPDPAPVFQKLSELYDDATARMKASLWPLQAVGVFEFGREFIGPTSVAWRFADPRDKERLAFRASGMLQSIGKAPARVRDEIAKQCPRGFAFHGGNVCTAKPSDMIRLADMKHHMCGPVHVAWLLCSLYSLCSGFDALGIVHAGIGPNTVYVSPSRHLAAVIGGWWHARSWGSDIDAVPRFTDRVLP